MQRIYYLKFGPFSPHRPHIPIVAQCMVNVSIWLSDHHSNTLSFPRASIWGHVLVSCEMIECGSGINNSYEVSSIALFFLCTYRPFNYLGKLDVNKHKHLPN